MDDFGFKKIEINKVVNPKVVGVNSAQNTQPKNALMKAKKTKKFYTSRPFGTLAALLVIFILVSAFLGVRAFAIYKNVKKVQAQAKIAYAAIKQQNVELAHDELVKTQQQIEVLKKDVDSTIFLSYIPLIGSYYSDLDHIVAAGSYGIHGGITTTDAIIPYADVLGLKGKGSFVMGSAEDRIRLAVKTLGKVVPKIDEIEKDLILAKKEVDLVDSNRYPNFGPFKKVRDQVQQIKDLTDAGVLAVGQGKPLIKVLPELLGEGKGKKYLVLFQNDKELRPTGGFWTFFSLFRVEEGVIKVDASTNIYDLDDSIANHPPAPRIIDKYLPKVDRFYIRDSNLSPDFAESVKQFNEFYNKSSLKQQVDGVIAVDTQLLVHILDILGDVQTSGQTFNTKIDPACDCPQVVYQLELTTTKPVGYVRENRKAILGDLLYAIMQKALKSSPREYWGRLFQQGIKDINEKHILFNLNDTDAQHGIEALNWGGRIREFQGDYLHINDANFGGAKSNMFTTSTVKVEYSNKNGEVSKTITISYKNDHKYSDCNLERGGLCLNATLRDFQRIYVPKGAVLESSKGSEVKVETRDDLGKTTYEAFLTVNPLGRAQIIYTYTLPFKLKAGSDLPVLIQKQPGVDKIPYEIYVNGRKVQSFDLVADKELSLKM